MVAHFCSYVHEMCWPMFFHSSNVLVWFVSGVWCFIKQLRNLYPHYMLKNLYKLGIIFSYMNIRIHQKVSLGLEFSFLGVLGLWIQFFFNRYSTISTIKFFHFLCHQFLLFIFWRFVMAFITTNIKPSHLANPFIFMKCLSLSLELSWMFMLSKYNLSNFLLLRVCLIYLYPSFHFLSFCPYI